MVRIIRNILMIMKILNYKLKYDIIVLETTKLVIKLN